MKRLITMILASLLVSFVSASIFVYPSQTVGPIKLMNGVNNGPAGPVSNTNSPRNVYALFRAARIPYARTHDSSFSAHYGGEHTVDITAIFPDFSKKADDPSAYDFDFTDWYLNRIRMVGTEPFFRLGQKIEHGIKKYGIMPPKDYKKWAEICEHIIRHYNEGWNNGFHWNLQYWEIWNEPDLESDKWRENPLTWGGPEEEFFKLYTITAKHLKKCFPQYKIGGPALCSDKEWADRYLTYIAKEKVPLDFFSWHGYSNDPKEYAALAVRYKGIVEKHGYTGIETMLDEWNYVRSWTDRTYSYKQMRTQKGAAFCAATMSACQDSPVDMLMYYDARIDTPWNALFDNISYAALPPYYAFYGWGRLLDYGTQVKATTDENDLYATAATDGKGNTAIYIARYTEDDNVSLAKTVKVNVDGQPDGRAWSHFVDSSHLYTQMPLEVKNGVVEVDLEPNALVMIELQGK